MYWKRCSLALASGAKRVWSKRSGSLHSARWRWITRGSAVAVGVWLAASLGFSLYVSNFGSYNKTYGALAGIIIFLVWFWLTNVALLFGIELDAEIERSREIKEGVPQAEKEIQLDARANPKPSQTS